MGGRIGNQTRNYDFWFTTSSNTFHIEGPSEIKPSEPPVIVHTKTPKTMEEKRFKMHSKLMTKSELVFSPLSRTPYQKGKSMENGDGQGKWDFESP